MDGRKAALIFMQMLACASPPADGSGGYVPPVPPDPPDPPPTPDPPDPNVIWGIMGTGQSLSAGAWALPTIWGSGSYQNLKLGYNTTVFPWEPTQLVPIGEPLRDSSAAPYPYNIQGETVHTIMSEQISYLSIQRTGYDYRTYHAAVGRDGWAMYLIEKNGIGKPPTPTDPVGIGYSYQAMLDELALTIPLAMSQFGKTIKFRASTLTHGESDYPRIEYGSEVRRLQQNQKADLFALSSQPMTDPFSLIASQASGFPNTGSTGLIYSASSLWDTSVQYPGEIVLACPKYQYNYVADNIHLTAPSEDRLGVKYGQVYDALVRGTGWKPLQPNKIEVSGSLLTLSFDIPSPPIQWDETIVVHQVAHTEWANGRGFEVLDGSGPLTILSATIVGEQVQLLLAGIPGPGLRVRYSMVNDGDGYKRGGQLTDSDPFVGVDSHSYSVSFTNGSTSAVVAGQFNHGPRDMVVSNNLLPNTLILSATGNNIVMSNPWTGTTGSHNVTIRFDNRNYLVIFDLAAPYTAP